MLPCFLSSTYSLILPPVYTQINLRYMSAQKQWNSVSFDKLGIAKKKIMQLQPKNFKRKGLIRCTYIPERFWELNLLFTHYFLVTSLFQPISSQVAERLTLKLG